MEQDADTTGKQVIARAAAVLKTLEGQPQGLNVAEITRQSGLPRSTVQRIVSALAGQQMVALSDGRVRLGPAITRLAGSTHFDVGGIARPHMETLAHASRETVNLSVLRGSHAVLVEQVTSDRELRVVSPVGAALPLYCTAHGKALLAAMDETERQRRLEGPWERKTAHTVGSLAALRKQLQALPADGVASDENEHIDGVSGIGIVVQTASSERYALSLVMPSVRFSQAFTVYAPQLIACARAVSAAFASGTG